MNKKNVTLLFALLAILLLMGACSMSGGEATTEEPVNQTEVPAETEIAATENPVTEESPVTDETSPACMSQLDDWLNNDGEWAEETVSIELDEEKILTTYQVNEEEISAPRFESNVPEELVSYQQDTERHAYLWKFFTDMIPSDQRTIIGEFVIFSDGYDNTIGAVDDADTPGKWTLEMDILDSEDLPTLATTLIHEFGHMLTLNEGQLDDKAATCDAYLSIDGCTKSDSYMNDFYNAFWTDIYDEWADAVDFSNGEVDEDLVVEFYDEYPDQFVTDYAPTGPEEDIAESWIYFIFGSKPAGDTIAEQKVLFFYNYPELVTLRQQILNGLCQYTGE
jgi:hypothetical protein